MVVSGQWSVVSGQWSVKEAAMTTDHRPPTTDHFHCLHLFMQEIFVEWLIECDIFRVFPQPEGEFLSWAGDER